MANDNNYQTQQFEPTHKKSYSSTSLGLMSSIPSESCKEESKSHVGIHPLVHGGGVAISLHHPYQNDQSGFTDETNPFDANLTNDDMTNMRD